MHGASRRRLSPSPMLVWLAALLAILSAPSIAQCVRQSPAHSVALVELYTSEGCDSCPPADRWLSAMGPAHAPHAAIPLSLHVDYWDYLGWKDRFADARLTRRQQQLTRLAGGKVVYTPGVFVNLRAFRGWDSAVEWRKALDRITSRPARATIRLALSHGGESYIALDARFELLSGPGGSVKRPQAYIALYENGLQTEVRAGENRGARLRHDYVVRRLIGPLEFAAGKAQFSRIMDIEAGWQRANLGVAAFVQDEDGLDVLQATALNVCG